MTTQNHALANTASYKLYSGSLTDCLPERIQKKIQFSNCPIPGVSGECWIFSKNINPDGYARLWWEGKQRRAHRVIYELLVGPIPVGFGLDHLCRVKHCANPAHLEPVTQRENTKRGLGVGVYNAAKTCCPQGHEYTFKSTYNDRQGFRHCRACQVAATKRWLAKKSKEVAA